MDKREMKIFRDNVHGYIEVPVDYVINFVDTDLFQRLRGIEQTGMRVLYPSARHDRFIHSLGTFYLGTRAFFCFRENVKRSYGNTHYKIFELSEKNERFWDSCQCLFEIACLLHDCGHAPFSHTLEFHYDAIPYQGGGSDLKTELKRRLGSNEFRNDFEGQGSPHELMSALLVCTDYSEALHSLLKKYGLDDIEPNPTEFIARMIIGCKYKQETKENQLKNCFIEMLNSGSIDMDSLDYIVRDAKLSGIDNMAIDIDRLLGSLTLAEITEFNNEKFYKRQFSTNIIKGRLEGRKKGELANINAKCRGQLKLNKSCQGTICGQVDVSGNFATKNSVSVRFSEDRTATILINGAPHADAIPKINEPVSVDFCCVLENGLELEGSNLHFRSKTNGKLELSSNEVEFSATYVDGFLDGVFSGKMLGNQGHAGGVVKCTLGFHKSSLSVIQNVVLARNYEYQWIYSHHKVVYYANYLLVDLLRNCVDFLTQNSKDGMKNTDDNRDVDVDTNALPKMLSWMTMISNDDDERFRPYFLDGQPILRPSDADIMAIFHKCYIRALQSESPLKSQLLEYYSRKYKRSLWKSYAEFYIFFSDFTLNEKKEIFSKLQYHSSYKLMRQYGYLEDSWEREFRNFGLKDVVWVNGFVKTKVLNPDSTFILFKDRVLTYGTVNTGNEVNPIESSDLFYLYYNPVSQDGLVDKAGLQNFFRAQLS